MKRFPVTVLRNDGRRQGFRRWTVYVGDAAAFDVEAQQIGNGSALVHVINSDGNEIAAFDGRTGKELVRS